MNYSIGFLTVGAVLVIAAAWRLYVGRACVFRTAIRVSGETDRGSVFVSVGLLVMGATVFIAGGLHALSR